MSLPICTMYRVLVIGCGGSGAKTLGYMMDQLRADLRVYGIEEIPGCWQFLNVDTPLQEESPKSIAPVSKQGGHYVSCGVSSGAYRVVDEALVEDVQACIEFLFPNRYSRKKEPDQRFACQ